MPYERRECRSQFECNVRECVDHRLESNKEGMKLIACRIGCGACCIAPSLSSAIPGMPHGKPAGIRCVQLTADNFCKIYGMAERPDVCVSYKATQEFCGTGRSEALRLLCELERSTSWPAEGHNANGDASFVVNGRDGKSERSAL